MTNARTPSDVADELQSPDDKDRRPSSPSSNPLSFAAEWRRQWKRRRTAWTFGITAALPLIIVAAFALAGNGGDATSGDPGQMMSRLATSSAANFTLFTLLVSSGVLLYIVAALFMGDPVPSEASWSSLRYLLTAPVPRARLLTIKLAVGMAYIATLIVGLFLWTLLIGLIAYGAGPFEVLGGGRLEWASLAPRFAIALVYIFIQLLPLGAIAFWVGTRTDAPLASVGSALVALIVAGILDAIPALGDWRNGLPGHYVLSWLGLMQAEPQAVELMRGTAWSVLYAVIFTFLGFRHFLGKNVLS